MRPIALLALLLAACAAPAPESLELDEQDDAVLAVEPTVTHTAPVGPVAITLTPADETLRAALVAADEAWEAAGVDPGRIVVAPVAEDGSSRWEPGETVAETCGYPGRVVDACTSHRLQRVLVRPSMDPRRVDVVLLHELGHLLAGGGNGHLGGCPEEVPGDDVMCSHGSEEAALTPRDLAYVAN